MGQDTRSLFQYLKDEGYGFLIGGFHVKGQVIDAKGVSGWGYGGQTMERGDWKAAAEMAEEMGDAGAAFSAAGRCAGLAIRRRGVAAGGLGPGADGCSRFDARAAAVRAGDGGLAVLAGALADGHRQRADTACGAHPSRGRIGGV